MLRTTITIILLSVIIIVLTACGKNGDPTTPADDNPDMCISISRLNPNHPMVDSINIKVTRFENGTFILPGRTIEIIASSGDVGLVTDRGDGTYDAIWTGIPGGEVTITANDIDSDPPIQAGLTFLALEFLAPEWDAPIKLKSPISTDGWETGSFIYPDGDKLAFAYITLDMVALAAGVTRSIGEERPGQSVPKTLDIYIAEPPNNPPANGGIGVWWSGWKVEHAQTNLFQSTPMHIAAPSVTSDGYSAFCTVQEFNGLTYDPTTIYSVDPEFLLAPTPLGSPVDMTGLGEDNPYYDVTNGWLYFDTYDLGDPLSKQNIWAAQSIGGGQFDDPIPLTDLNTIDIETQPFMHEPAGMLYFASDRGAEEFQLTIWRALVYGDYTNQPELVTDGEIAMGHPSISYDGEWFCFTYARFDSYGANADIAMSRRIE